MMIPAQLIESHQDESPEWLAGLPAQLDEYLTRWELTRTGGFLNGAASLIVPVVRRDGTDAMLKLQPCNDENAAEALGLRTWRPTTWSPYSRTTRPPPRSCSSDSTRRR